MTKIYVGNLPFSATESEIRDLFAQHGTVDSVALPTDRETGRPLRVNEAQDRPRTGGGGRPGGGGRSGGGGYGGGGYGGGGGGGGYGGGGGGGQRRW